MALIAAATAVISMIGDLCRSASRKAPSTRYAAIIPTMKLPELDTATLDRIIQMAWEDRTPFDAIALQFGLNESSVVVLMRKHLKRSSFEMWRKRMAGRNTKHRQVRDPQVTRFRASGRLG